MERDSKGSWQPTAELRETEDWSVEKWPRARQGVRDEEAERERSEGRVDSIRDSGTI